MHLANFIPRKKNRKKVHYTWQVEASTYSTFFLYNNRNNSCACGRSSLITFITTHLPRTKSQLLSSTIVNERNYYYNKKENAFWNVCESKVRWMHGQFHNWCIDNMTSFLINFTTKKHLEQQLLSPKYKHITFSLLIIEQQYTTRSICTSNLWKIMPARKY